VAIGILNRLPRRAVIYHKSRATPVLQCGRIADKGGDLIGEGLNHPDHDVPPPPSSLFTFSEKFKLPTAIASDERLVERNFTTKATDSPERLFRLGAFIQRRVRSGYLELLNY
jgi:hypothetical protein